MVEAREGEYRWSIEIVSRWPVLLPALPLLAILREHVERLILLVPLSEMHFIHWRERFGRNPHVGEPFELRDHRL